MKQFWEERYAESEYVYGTVPNEFFKSFLDQHPAGRLLLPAEGEGRNAVYAARHGWMVTAFDYSENARQKALALAGQDGVTLDYQVTELRLFDFPEAAFDVVGLFFVHLPPADRAYLHQQVIRSLRPGGKVALEAFSKEQLAFQSGGPRHEAMLFDTRLLSSDFSGLQIPFLKQEKILLQEGRYHQGEASVVRMLANKK